MEKAFAYLRVSGKGQVDGDGFPRQKNVVNLDAIERPSLFSRLVAKVRKVFKFTGKIHA
jgi:hypothetical protein